MILWYQSQCHMSQLSRLYSSLELEPQSQSGTSQLDKAGRLRILWCQSLCHTSQLSMMYSWPELEPQSQ